MTGSTNNTAADAVAAKADCTSQAHAACFHIKVDCKTAKADAKLAAAKVMCKDDAKDAELWGCAAAADCVKGVYALPTADQTANFST